MMKNKYFETTLYIAYSNMHECDMLAINMALL